MTDYFQMLDISIDLEGDELKTALAEKRKLWLNLCNSPDLMKRQNAEVMLQLIDEAETVLLDQEKRAEYISQLHGTGGGVKNNEGDLQSYRDKIKVLCDEEKWQDVISLGEIANRIYPNDPLIWMYLGRASYMLKRYEEAVSYYSQALELSPTEGFIYAMIGDCRYMQNKNFEAAKMYRSARLLNYEESFLLHRLAVCLEVISRQMVDLPLNLPVQGKALKRGFDEEAIQIMDELYRQDPSNNEYKTELEDFYVDKLFTLTEKYLGRTAFFSLEGPFKFQINGKMVESYHIWWNHNKRMPNDGERREILELMDKIYIHLNMGESATITGTTRLVADILDFMGIENAGNKITKRQIQAMGQLIDDINQDKVPLQANQSKASTATTAEKAKASQAAADDSLKTSSYPRRWLLPVAGILAVGIIIIILIKGIAGNQQSYSTPAANSNPTFLQNQSPAYSEGNVNFSKIETIINNEGQGGEYSVYIKDLNTGKDYYSPNKDQSFVAAGSSFLPIFAVLSKQRNEHTIDSQKRIEINENMLIGGTGILSAQNIGNTYTIDELGSMMLKHSDNSAANILIDELGGIETVNRYFENIGLRSTKLNRRLMDKNAINLGIENYTSVNDLGKLLEIIANSDYKQLLTHNNGQYLPNGCEVYHLVGLLTKVYNDSSIVTGTHSKFLVIVMSKGTSNETAQQVVANIIQSTYSDLEQ